MIKPSLNICVVEDDEDAAHLLKRYLEMNGHIVHCAEDVQTALLTLATQVIDVLVCDIQLPDGNGWEIMELAKARGYNPVGLAISGFTTEEDKAKSYEAGFRFHLAKPFLFEELLALLAKVETGQSNFKTLPKCDSSGLYTKIH
ncbi:MAG: response regulator [Chthoniobacterales bacterium]